MTVRSSGSSARCVTAEEAIMSIAFTCLSQGIGRDLIHRAGKQASRGSLRASVGPTVGGTIPLLGSHFTRKDVWHRALNRFSLWHCLTGFSKSNFSPADLSEIIKRKVAHEGMLHKMLFQRNPDTEIRPGPDMTRRQWLGRVARLGLLFPLAALPGSAFTWR